MNAKEKDILIKNIIHYNSHIYYINIFNFIYKIFSKNETYAKETLVEISISEAENININNVISGNL